MSPCSIYDSIVVMDIGVQIGCQIGHKRVESPRAAWPHLPTSRQLVAAILR